MEIVSGSPLESIGTSGSPQEGPWNPMELLLKPPLGRAALYTTPLPGQKDPGGLGKGFPGLPGLPWPSGAPWVPLSWQWCGV